MSVIVSFPHGEDWWVPNWIYSHFMEAACDYCFNDPRLQLTIQMGRWINCLWIEKMSSEEAAKVMIVFRTVAKRILAGEVPSTVRGDPEWQKSYLEALQQLVVLIEKQLH